MLPTPEQRAEIQSREPDAVILYRVEGEYIFYVGDEIADRFPVSQLDARLREIVLSGRCAVVCERAKT